MYLSMKTLTDFRKTVETGVDPGVLERETWDVFCGAIFHNFCLLLFKSDRIIFLCFEFLRKTYYGGSTMSGCEPREHK